MKLFFNRLILLCLGIFPCGHLISQTCNVSFVSEPFCRLEEYDIDSIFRNQNMEVIYFERSSGFEPGVVHFFIDSNGLGSFVYLANNNLWKSDYQYDFRSQDSIRGNYQVLCSNMRTDVTDAVIMRYDDKTITICSPSGNTRSFLTSDQSILESPQFWIHFFNGVDAVRKPQKNKKCRHKQN